MSVLDQYKRPVCDCGNELVAIEEEINVVETGIIKNGKLNRKNRTIRNGYSENYWLRCNVCGKEYELDFDGERRVLRGDER